MIRVAVIGGGIGAQHLEAYRHLPQFDPVLIVDRDPARLEALAIDGTSGASEIAEALHPDIDLVDICLPPALHAETAIQALEAGKHVICEKPFATSLHDVDRIAQAAARADCQVFPVFQYRFGPAFAQLRALRDAGLTGAPHSAALETHWSRDADYYAVPWRGTWAGEQGGAIVTHAIHAHDLLSHYMAPVHAVTARLATRVNPIETEDTAALIFELEGGALATSSVTLGAASDQTRIRFVYECLTATSGTLPYAPSEGGWSFIARAPSDQAEVDACLASAADEKPGFDGFLTEVAKALNGDPAHRAVSLADGRASIELVTAIYSAAQSARRTTLPLSADHPMRMGWRP
ncbi:Gfo/Idh/MocA family protein [Thalassococcus sp. S3]|uniref:Gfo/Idh/MocA family protein n=1 Tax=Thalassococcus sp. S3 TaxID=2017482 RepID=UPI0010246B43|nr:Gfo/Idh/MocA family oxidoreductase [Thalassococcus sp. S3]QBF34322.1 oxidoreductase [Thalassococcus sp. S3]